MPNLRDIKINKTKRYLVLSESPHFLETSKNIICRKLGFNIVNDTKTRKNSMVIDPIFFHDDGGFIRFSLYEPDNFRECMYKKKYDIVLIDRDLFVNKYVDVHSTFILSSLVWVDVDEEDLLKEIDHSNEASIKDRHHDVRFHIDFGKCYGCKEVVRQTDNNCPYCGRELNWDLDKSTFLLNCKSVIESKRKGEFNVDTVSEVCFDPYVCITEAFTYDELFLMADEELRNLYDLADKTCIFLHE